MEDSQRPDASAERRAGLTEKELDEKFPNRPKNHGKTLPFHELFVSLFNPLNENKRPTGPPGSRRRHGPHGPSKMTPHELRRSIIERFISRWRNEVGNDIFPAFRLILPDKDRDRPMYGLKEKTIGKLLVKVMRIDKNSEDGYNLINWKIPGHSFASRMAGDFAGRCGEIIRKRPMRSDVGSLTIGEVNDLLDRLSAEQKEEGQAPIFKKFYTEMNPDELTWLIRIILRQMKVGATERTFFDIWHPDATNLFNVSSSLRRVCYELYDTNFRLEGDEKSVSLMQCFQPQLAQFQMHSIQKMVEKMRPEPDDIEFWVEEKLDGERMQMHMIRDDNFPGGRRFGFWSRKAKDYTYLYGNSLRDDNSALTRHLTSAFSDVIDSIILDGEMITWDPEQDAIVPFGTLKTAALAEQRNPFSNKGQRPLYRIFDCLHLNGATLTKYTLRDRRKALETVVKPVHRRFEIHSYTSASTAEEVDSLLRKVVSEASEGLVMKNPRSAYRLNERNDDWMKVKPEYMTEFGENLDCIVIGGYYGTGHRGGNLSSFLCGLRVNENQIRGGANPMKCYSFFKVGGGLTAADYSSIRNKTDGKWKEWNTKRPPTEYIELAGGSAQIERPDVWIKPDDSVVISVKAASVTSTETFRTGFTLRFPRFKSVRYDRDWTSALTLEGFSELKAKAETEHKEKKFEIDSSRRKRARTTKKKELTIAGNEEVLTPYAGETTNVFQGLNFFIMSECLKPKMSKGELEQFVKANGGKFYQTHNAVPGTLCIADKRVMKASSLIHKAEKAEKEHREDDEVQNIIRPQWLLDCVKQSFTDRDKPRYIIPLEDKHMLFATSSSKPVIAMNTDEYGDSYARDVEADELKKIIEDMPEPDSDFSARTFRAELTDSGYDLPETRSWLFEDLVFYFEMPETDGAFDIKSSSLWMRQAKLNAAFGRATIHSTLIEGETTHVIFPPVDEMDERDKQRLKDMRWNISTWDRLPRIVSADWIEECWNESTVIDEERFAIVA